MTDDTGSYSMPVFSGSWDVSVSASDLQSRGYAVAADQNVFVNTTAVTVYFEAQQTGVVTNRATGITSTGAILNASVNATGDSIMTSFQWGLSEAALTNTVPGVPNTVSGGVTRAVKGLLDFLTPSTTYYYQTVGSAGFGTIRGSTRSFKTNAAVTNSAVITLTPTSITFSSATLNGSINPKGVTTEVRFQTGTTTAYSDSIPATPSSVSGTTVTSVNTSAIGLLAHTTYHFRVQGASDLGLANGADLTFKTLDRVPTANADSFNVLPGAKATLDVLANDTDPDGDVLTIASFTQPASGGTVAKVGNTLVFTALPSFTGSTFNYTAGDGFGGTSTAAVTLVLGTCSLTPPSVTPASAGTTYSVGITANGAWSVSEALPWASVSPLSGVGNGSVSVTLLANTAPTSRTGTINIGGQTHTITQAGVLLPGISVPWTIPLAIVSGYYSLAVPTTNPPVTYTVAHLPLGLAINQTTGVISGTPMLGDTSHVTVRAANAAGTTATLNFDIVVQALPGDTVGTFRGLINRDPVLNANLGSRLELATTATGSFTGKIVTGITAKAIAGRLIADAMNPDQPECLVSIPRTGTTPLILDVILTATTNSLTGTLSDGGLYSSAANGWRNAWSAATPATDYQTFYTFSLEQTDPSSDLPQGYGHGSFSVAATTGSLVASGMLADGNAFICSTFLGQGGEVLLYQSLYSNKGSLAGVLTVTTGATPVDNTIAGTPSWYKPEPAATSTDTVYRPGFGPIPLIADGGGYAVPLAGEVVMGLPNVTNNVQLNFTGGGLSTGEEPNITFSITNPSPTGFINKVTMPLANPNKVTMTVLTPATGAFSGGFTIPGATVVLNRTVTYQGRIVYQAGVPRGYGYFLMPQLPLPGQTLTTSPKLSGTVLLAP